MIAELKPIQTILIPPWWPPEPEVVAFFREILPIHHFLPLTYKLRLLRSLARLFPEGPCRVLDLGAGDGLMVTAIGKFFPVSRICGVDVTERINPAAKLDFSVYDGIQLPYPDKEFDVVLVCNVLHHVPRTNRRALLAEVARVTASTIIIKDHLARGVWSRTSLGLADWVGNAPFGGMVNADYLDSAAWTDLLAPLPFSQEYYHGLGLQRGLRNLFFPDRNEILIRLQAGRDGHGN